MHMMSTFATPPRILIFPFLLCLIIGCAVVPPKKSEFESSKTYDQNYDTVWEAIIAFCSDTNTPIKTIEKVSGIIATDEMNVPHRIEQMAFVSDLCDCGSPGGLSGFRDFRGKYNIFVQRKGDQNIVKINTDFKASTWFGQNFLGWTPCYSSGQFERTFFNYLDFRMKIKRGYIGINVDRKTNVIINVFPGYPGEKAGLASGDKIIQVNGQELQISNFEILTSGPPGETLDLVIIRGNETIRKNVKRGE